MMIKKVKYKMYEGINKTVRKVIISMIRSRLGLTKYEQFRFTNQKTQDVYYFTTTSIIKITNKRSELSGVSLNWLLSPTCKITKVS